MYTKINKIQINRQVKIGKDRWGKPISETTEMVNVRTDTVKEALDLYEATIKGLLDRRAKRRLERKVEDLK